MSSNHGSLLSKCPKRLRRGNLCLALLVSCLVLSGCGTPGSRYSLKVPMGWAFKEQLKSVPESEPHGMLILNKNSAYIYVLVDDYAAFRSIEGNKVLFRLAPGEHQIAARYAESSGKSVTYTDVLKSSVKIRQNKITVISLFADWQRLRIDVTELE